MPIPPAAVELLTALVPALDRWGRWYLFGAQAVVAHGVPTKILAGRPKDLEDARGLWQVRGHGLDAGRIRGVLRLLEQALSQSDLVPTFDAIVAAASD